MVLFAVEEKYEGFQKGLSRNEVAELSEAELIRLVHLQLGITKVPWTRRFYPHGGKLLLINSGQKYVRPARKILRKREFGGLSPNPICPGKSSGPNGIRHPHRVKIYDVTNGRNNLRTKHTKFFLLPVLYTCASYMPSNTVNTILWILWNSFLSLFSLWIWPMANTVSTRTGGRLTFSHQ